jgi:hypothetical protein
MGGGPLVYLASDDEKTCLTDHLRQVVNYKRFPLSRKIRMLKAIVTKLEPPAKTVDPLLTRMKFGSTPE